MRKGVPHRVHARVVFDVRILHGVAKNVASKVDLRLCSMKILFLYSIDLMDLFSYKASVVKKNQ